MIHISNEISMFALIDEDLTPKNNYVENIGLEKFANLLSLLWQKFWSRLATLLRLLASNWWVLEVLPWRKFFREVNGQMLCIYGFRTMMLKFYKPTFRTMPMVLRTLAISLDFFSIGWSRTLWGFLRIWQVFDIVYYRVSAESGNSVLIQKLGNLREEWGNFFESSRYRKTFQNSGEISNFKS